ncbi:MAG: hypothetical protein ACOC1P_05340 [Minisyncoccales bacterium]
MSRFNINLQKIDIKKNPINVFVHLPHKIRNKKIGAFFETKNPKIDTITEADFKKYSNKKEAKKFVRNYDFFIAQAKLMPKVATNFGKVLGPAGKMPSPQLGIISEINDKSIEELKEKINKNIKLRLIEPSIKVSIGKSDMEREKLIENINSFYKEVLKLLPREKENIKDIKIKYTMSKPHKIEIK